MIEHSVCEGLLGYGTDFSRDTEADLMDGFKGFFIKDGLFCPCQFEVMCDIELALIGAESGHMVSDGDSLVERFHDGKLHDSSQIGLACEHEDKGVIRVHFEVGEEPKLL